MRGATCFAMALMLTAAVPSSLMAQKAAAKSAAHANPAAERAQQLAQAEAAMDHAQWPQAEEILRKLVAANGKDTQAWFDLGYTMHAQGNYEEAIKAYRSAVAAQPTSFECNLNLGLMLAHEHRAEAAQVLERTTQLKPSAEQPKKALARAWAALAELRDKDAKAAQEDWDKAAELDPSLENLLSLAEAQARADNSEMAEQTARRAAAIDPAATDAQVVLANLYMQSKRLPEAEAALQKVLAAHPEDENAHLQLGRVLSLQEKYDAAAAELQKALGLKSDDWDAVRELAFACDRLKKWPEAERYYRALATHFPGDAGAHDGLGAALMAQLKYAGARDEFLSALKLKPAWGEVWGRLAMALAGNQQYDMAIKALGERAKYLPETPSTYFLRATYFDHLRIFPEAVENYKAFLAVSKGQFPDEEWKARHRLIAIEPEAQQQKKKK